MNQSQPIWAFLKMVNPFWYLFNRCSVRRLAKYGSQSDHMGVSQNGEPILVFVQQIISWQTPSGISSTHFLIGSWPSMDQEYGVSQTGEGNQAF